MIHETMMAIFIVGGFIAGYHRSVLILVISVAGIVVMTRLLDGQSSLSTSQLLRPSLLIAVILSGIGLISSPTPKREPRDNTPLVEGDDNDDR